jgi:hypothetical protein
MRVVLKATPQEDLFGYFTKYTHHLFLQTNPSLLEASFGVDINENQLSNNIPLSH